MGVKVGRDPGAKLMLMLVFGRWGLGWGYRLGWGWRLTWGLLPRLGLQLGLDLNHGLGLKLEPDQGQ